MGSENSSEIKDGDEEQSLAQPVSVRRTKSESYTDYVRRMRNKGAAKETKKVIRRGTVAEKTQQLLSKSSTNDAGKVQLR